MKENITYKKAFVFAKEIVNLYKYLVDVNASEKLIIKCKELNKILNSIVKTTKKNLKIIDD